MSGLRNSSSSTLCELLLDFVFNNVLYFFALFIITSSGVSLIVQRSMRCMRGDSRWPHHSLRSAQRSSARLGSVRRPTTPLHAAGSQGLARLICRTRRKKKVIITGCRAKWCARPGRVGSEHSTYLEYSRWPPRPTRPRPAPPRHAWASAKREPRGALALKGLPLCTGPPDAGLTVGLQGTSGCLHHEPIRGERGGGGGSDKIHRGLFRPFSKEPCAERTSLTSQCI